MRETSVKMSSASVMSPLSHIFYSFSESTFQILKQFVNRSVGFDVAERNLIMSTLELSDIFGSTSLACPNEFLLLAAAGSVCFFSFVGIWNICAKMMALKNTDAPSKERLLQLIKKAHLPCCTDMIIEEIKKHGIDVNEKVSPAGLSFFLCGCLTGVEDLISQMIKMGANVHEETTEGDTALYLATYAVLHSAEPNTNTLRLLIKAGCNVNKQNKRGYTPLHRAASKGNLKVIQYLLLEGANQYIANNAGIYPVDSAVCAGHIEAAQLLKLNFPSPYVWDVVEPHTPLHIKMGLQSPHRKPLLNSRHPRLRNVFT